MYLISFKDVQFAHTFVDYMATKGVVIRLEFDADGYSQLFLDHEDENLCQWVKAELAAYIKNPYDKRYIDAAWQQGGGKSSKLESASLTGIFPKIALAGPITVTITIICIVLYGLLLLLGPKEILTYFGYPILDSYKQAWRYFTPIFIHFSLLHILFNLMWWWYLGSMVERRIGRFKLLELVLIAGVLSNYAQDAISGPYFGGLSGVVYALMGYVWLYGEKVRSSGIGLDRVMIGVAVIWLVAGYIGILGSIANTAHLVGLIVGILLAAKDIWLLNKKSR